MIVGHGTADDAGVYKLTDDLALIQTVDFFTPIVDDPYMFGQIAAANALSDVYAMGGIPKTVLNIVGFPIKKLPHEVLAQILKGAADKTAESGAVIAGGHSIDDQEPKFGMSVTGLIHPDKIFRNVGAKPGDVLVLTKPIGVGITTTGIKQGKSSKEQEAIVTKLMAELNKVAGETLMNYNPNAVTDITGFGLAGHAYEMASGSEVSMKIRFADIPCLEGTRELAERGAVPGGTKANRLWLLNEVEYGEEIDEINQFIICDAITSGGLLISMPKEQAEQYIEEYNAKSEIKAHIIGEIVEKKEKSIYVY